MEKSHHAAKAASQAHTQHGGTKDRTSIIVQQYQHWYRNIQHRYARKMAQQSTASACSAAEASHVAEEAQRRRRAWTSSGAAARLSEWREGRVRQGRRWGPIAESYIRQEGLDTGDTIDTTPAASTEDHIASQWEDEDGPSRTVEYAGSTEESQETEYGEDHVTNIN